MPSAGARTNIWPRERARSLAVAAGITRSALPFRDGAVDLTLFVTTLEFLEDPAMALRDLGPMARATLLGQARDVTILSLRAMVRMAAGTRLSALRWASTLFPDGLWAWRSSVPLGDVIGIAARLTAPSASL